MRAAVLGAGSIGCVVGAALSETAEVRLIGRPRVVDAVREHGLRVTGYDGSEHRVPAGTLEATTHAAAAEGCDVLLVTVKSGATQEAVREVQPYLRPDTVVVSLQNGLRNTDRIREVLRAHAVLAGMVSFNVVQTDPAVLHRATSGEVMVADDPAVADLADLASRTWLPFRTRTDMVEVQYAKLLLNLMNAVVALADRPLKECLGERDYRRVLAACQREALAVFAAQGVRPARLGPIPAAAAARVLTLPDALFTRLAAAQLQVDPNARSSMWDDLQRGRTTEIEELQGAVVQLGAEHGVATPACARLVELVHDAEDAGPGRGAWSGPGLLAEVATGR
ncbi:2-dehydropantoate 2-reductase [Luteipulveratus sp. YIM 133132]|uniref:2-dehydropantoate 2-reductase n=1 Tax=Luteipulveratus flavus TaxID=3031728 RepID=UPI0023AEDB4D|nr:2-dehydropantoate 2-reductase [Luteipulveratus sp. YIM 133132]MDE9366319.1 2-dehydropantoate 2-reductase [Luteipulveratus sp. YIM 133132]